MQDIELLVHISASAGRQDDQRYLELAQSLIDFEPATVIRGTDLNGTTPVTSQERNSSQTQLLSSSSVSNGYHSPTLNPPPAFLSQSVASTGADKATKADEGQVARRTSSGNPNPPYKNPYHGPPRFWKPHAPYETPAQNQRPRTAPEQTLGTVQVPRTGHNNRRRHSDSTSFGSFVSHVSNSQPSVTVGLGGEEASTEILSSSALQADVGDNSRGLVRSLSQTSLEGEFMPHKRARTLERDQTEVTRIPRPAGIEAFFLRDRSLDWTSSPQTSDLQSSSIATTATPSQPVPQLWQEAQSPSKPSPAVILLSSGSSHQTQRGVAQPSEPPTSSIEYQTVNEPSDPTETEAVRSASTSRALFEEHGLMPEVTAPQPQVGEKHFVTHMTKTLQDFARQLPFDSYFRPVEVTRDVKVLERGYWLMEVAIVSKEVAEDARAVRQYDSRLPTMQERFQGATTAERLAKYDEAKRNGSLYQSGHDAEIRAQGLWTEDEFVLFWKDFSSFIQNGKAGWGTRLVGEELSDDESRGNRMIRVRIFTWGEVLGHMYLAVWVLSDKLCARVPMEWIASDGAHVVKMAGTRSGRGSLPTWSRKGHEGEKGCWGV